jgi:hypothetical protein
VDARTQEAGLGSAATTFPWLVRQPLPELGAATWERVERQRARAAQLGRGTTLMMDGGATAAAAAAAATPWTALVPSASPCARSSVRLVAVHGSVWLRIGQDNATQLSGGESMALPGGLAHTITLSSDDIAVWAYEYACKEGELHRALQLLSAQSAQV